MLDEKDSDERAIRFLIDCEKAIHTAKAIDPRAGALDFPPLATVAFRVPLCDWQLRWINRAIAALRSQRHDPTAAQLLPSRIPIVAFVQAEALRATTAFADCAAINCCQYVDLIIAVRFAQGPVQRVAVRIDDQVAFKAANPVFS